MSAFTGPLRLQHMDADWRHWRLLEPLVWEVDDLGSGLIVEVPAGFVTDGASVPRLLWWLLPMTGSYMRPAALHDYLCDRVGKGNPHPHAPSRYAADRQFLIAMKAVGVAAPVRLVMYAAVRFAAIVRGEK